MRSRCVYPVMFFVLAPSLLFGSQAKLPAIAEQTLFGQWESIGDSPQTIYVMELNPEGSSILVETFLGGMLSFKLVKAKVKDGLIELHFSHEKYDISIQGKGVANESKGVIDVEYVFSAPDVRQVRNLKFYKPLRLRQFADFEDAAVKEIIRLKKSK